MDIISKKLASGRFYAYHGGQFWFWDEARNIWKESHLMAKKYDLNHEFDKLLSPEDFLSDPSQFEALEDYQVDYLMKNALQDAKPCQTVPIEPVEEPEVPGTQTAQEKPLTTVPDAIRPAFDYSGLTDQTVEELHFAENEYRHGKQMAERGLVHMGNAIAAAHDALCGVVQQLDNSKHGNRGDDSFRAWCCSIGITKSSAYNLLQVSALMDGSSPRQRAILEALPPTLLYAVAKPSAPQELVEKVKNGEVTTNKAYQDLLKENQQLRTDRVEAMNRADRAEHKLEAAHADINGLAEQNSRLKDRATAAEAREEEAWKMQSKAETRAQEAEKQLEGSRQVAEAAKLRGDKLKAENDALKKQPITTVVDKEEVERQAREMAAEMTADLRAQLEQAASGSEQDTHSSYDNVLLADRSFQNIGKMVIPSLRRLPPEQREQLTNMLVHTLGQIQGEVSRCL